MNGKDLGNINLENYSIVVMPDFFIDRIVRLHSINELFRIISEKEKLGGGSIRDLSISDVEGGNAVNIAYCLAKLGVKVILFTVANDTGSNVLKELFSKFGDRVELRISNGKHGHTVAMEFENALHSKVNIMLNDVGDVANFGSSRIDDNDTRKILQNADGVMVVNWGSNLKGTELIEYAFENSPQAIHFIDPADIESRKNEFKDDLPKFSRMTNILSINENECNSILTALELKSPKLSTTRKNHHYDSNARIDHGEDICRLKESARILANKIKINTSVHVKKGAVWSDGKTSIFAQSFEVNDPRTLTGAGDAWNSANIVSNIIGLKVEEQLIISNAYASLYVANPYSEPPTLQETMDLLNKKNAI